MEEQNKKQQDITTGQQKLKGLRGLTPPQFFTNETLQESVNKNSQLSEHGNITIPDFAHNDRMELQSSGVDLGKSVYDAPTSYFYEEQAKRDVQNRRADEQGTVLKYLNGTLKGVGTAASTFVSNVGGFVVGVGQGVFNMATGNQGGSFWRGYSDNIVTRGMDSFNKAMEEYLPNYRSVEEENMSIPRKLLTANFWADEVVKNFGFMVGAAYSGGAFLKALSLAGKFRQLGALGSKIAGSAFSALGEASLEGLQNTNDFIDLEEYKLETEYNKRVAEIMNDPNMTNEQKGLAFQELDRNRALASEGIQERANAVNSAVMGGNFMLLWANDFFTLGKFFSKGFTNAKIANRNAIKQGAKDTYAAYEAKEASKAITDRFGRDQAGKATFKEYTNWDKAKKGLGLSREGFEEMNQGSIAEAATIGYEYDNPDSYYKALQDPKSEEEVAGFMSSLPKGFINTYGTGAKWEEFAVGWISALAGVPTFGKTRNSDSSTWLGKGKMVGMTGGLKGEINDLNTYNELGRKHVGKIVDFEEKFGKQKRNFVRSQSFTNAMDGFATEDNKFQYENAKDNWMFSTIESYAALGQLDSLKQLIDTDFENISDEELEEIAKTTTSENPGEGWKNVDGSLMSSTEEGRRKMRDDLSKKKNQILQSIKAYEDAITEVRQASNEALTDDQIQELAWLNFKTTQFNDRFQSLKKSDKFNSSKRAIREKKESLQNKLDQLNNEENNEELKQRLISTISDLDSMLQVFEGIQNAESLDELRATAVKDKDGNIQTNEEGQTLGLINEDVLNTLYKILDSNKDTTQSLLLKNLGIDPKEFKAAIQEALDCIKLSNSLDQFQNRYMEFLLDPSKISEQREKQKVKEEQKKQIDDLKKEQKDSKEAQEKEESSIKGYTDEELESIQKSLNKQAVDLDQIKKQSEEWDDYFKRHNPIEEMQKTNSERAKKINQQLLLNNLYKILYKKVLASSEPENIKNTAFTILNNIKEFAESLNDYNNVDSEKAIKNTDYKTRDQAIALIKSIISSLQEEGVYETIENINNAIQNGSSYEGVQNDITSLALNQGLIKQNSKDEGAAQVEAQEAKKLETSEKLKHILNDDKITKQIFQKTVVAIVSQIQQRAEEANKKYPIRYSNQNQANVNGAYNRMVACLKQMFFITNQQGMLPTSAAQYICRFYQYNNKTKTWKIYFKEEEDEKGNKINKPVLKCKEQDIFNTSKEQEDKKKEKNKTKKKKDYEFTSIISIDLGEKDEKGNPKLTYIQFQDLMNIPLNKFFTKDEITELHKEWGLPKPKENPKQYETLGCYILSTFFNQIYYNTDSIIEKNNIDTEEEIEEPVNNNKIETELRISINKEAQEESKKEYEKNASSRPGQNNGFYDYWMPSTTQLPIHLPREHAGKTMKDLLQDGIDGKYGYYRYNHNTASLEFHEVTDKERKRLLATFNYLESKGAFNRCNGDSKSNSVLKTGKKVHFKIIDSLNQEAGIEENEDPIIIITDEKGNVLGDLNYATNGTAQDQTSLLELQKDIKEKWQQQKSNTDYNGEFTYEHPSEIQEIVIGKIQYSEEYKPLNEISPEGFTLGISMRGGDIAIDGNEEHNTTNIIRPKKQVNGQPFLMVPTNIDPEEGYPLFIAVPIISQTFKKGTDYTLFKHLETLISKGIKSEDKEVRDSILGLINSYFNETTNFTCQIKEVQIEEKPSWSVKNSVTGKTTPIILTNENALDEILNALEGALIKIDVTQINSKKEEEYAIGNSTVKMTYNQLLGELIHCNLPVGGAKCQSTWFTIKRIDKEGKKLDTGYKQSSRGIVSKTSKETKKEDNGSDGSSTIINLNGVSYKIYQDSSNSNKLDVKRNSKSKAPISEQTKRNVFILNEALNKIKERKCEIVSYSTQKGNKSGYLVTLDDNTTVLINQDKNNIINKECIIDTNQPETTLQKELEKEGVTEPSEELIKDLKNEIEKLKQDAVSKVKERNKKTPFQNIKEITDFLTNLNLNIDSNKYIEKGLTEDQIKTIIHSLITTDFIQDLAKEVLENNNSTQAQIEAEAEKKSDLPNVSVKSDKKEESLNKDSIIKKFSKGLREKGVRNSDKISKEFTEDLTEEEWGNLSKLPIAKLNSMCALIMGKKLDASAFKQRLSNDSTRNRDIENTDVNSTAEQFEREIRKVRQVLPQLSKEDAIRVVEGIIKGNNKECWGQYHQGIITLVKNAARGTAYHEAFHYVIDMLLTSEEYKKVFEQAAKYYNMPTNNMREIIAIEERMARDFQRYMVEQEKYNDEKGFKGAIKKFFRELFRLLKQLFKKDKYLDNLFYSINKGEYASRKENTVSNNTELRNSETSYSQEMQSIKDKAIADGTFMKAPNGNPTNLTERQWLQVRTKAFKDWFGDWINPYKSNVSIKLDIDMESSDDDGFGTLIILKAGDKVIGTIPLQQQIKSTKDFKFTKYVDINSVAGAAEIFDEYRGQGFGKASYWELGMWLSRNGSILRSATDEHRTEAATRVWKSLERDGFAKKVDNRYEFINNASKVVDDNGEPLVVYHVSDTDFNIFDKEKANTRDSGYYGKGFYFSSLPKRIPGANIKKQFFINIRNVEELKQFDFSKTGEDLNDLDGRIVRNNDTLEERIEFGDVTNINQLTVKEPNQIKSATDNVGSFSNENDDIRYSEVNSEDTIQNSENISDLVQRLKLTYGQLINFKNKMKNSIPHKVIDNIVQMRFYDKNLAQKYVNDNRLKGIAKVFKRGYNYIIKFLTDNELYKAYNTQFQNKNINIKDRINQPKIIEDLTQEQKEALKDLGINNFEQMSREEQDRTLHCRI